MLFKSILLATSLVLSATTMAKSVNSPKKLKKSINQPITSGSFLGKKDNFLHTQVSFGVGQIKQGGSKEQDYGANQLALETGFTFGLPYSLSTTTVVGFRMLNFNDGDFITENQLDSKVVVDSFNGWDAGFAQRVNYQFNIQEVALRPFIFGGMSWGKYSADISREKDSIASNSNFNRVSFGFGAQAEYKNFLPEVKFEFSDVNYSDQAEVASNIGGQSKTENQKVEPNDQDGSAFIFSVGVGYRFF